MNAYRLLPVTLLALLLPGFAAAQAHGNAIMTVPSDRGGIFSSSAMLALNYTPSPEDAAYDNGVGGELSLLLNEDSLAGLRLSIGIERWQATERGPDDLQLVPLGIGFTVGGGIAPGMLGYMEAGVKYVVVGGDDNNLEDAVTGFVGAGIAFEAFSSGGLDLSIGYQFDIQESDNDAGDELSLEGVFLRVGLRAFP